MTYNSRMRTLRKERGYTQEMLSELVKVYPSTIKKFENLQNIPSDSVIGRIANVLETTPEDIFNKDAKKSIEQKFPYKTFRTFDRRRISEYERREESRLEEESSPETHLLLEEKNYVINKVLSTLRPNEERVIKMLFCRSRISRTNWKRRKK